MAPKDDVQPTFSRDAESGIGQENIDAADNEKVNLSTQAAHARSEEHAMTVMESLRVYPMAIFWSVVFGTSLIMVGYDAGLVPAFMGLPSFQKKYGQYYGPSIGYEVPTHWQNAIAMGTPVGQWIGSLTASYPMERWGRKKVFGVSLFCSACFIFPQMFAQTPGVLAAGEFLAGWLYGTYVVLAPTMASEYCPLNLRGILNASLNLAYVIGQFISSGITDGFEANHSQWGYRIPFAIQWVWIPLLGGCLWFAPESPYWLVRQGRSEEALKSLQRLARKSANIDHEARLAIIELTTRHEADLQKDTSFFECFRGTELIRTEVALMVQIWQVITGIALIGYCVYFFELAGLPDAAAFDMGVGNTGLGFLATCSSWFLMSYFGRRSIYTWGVALMGVFQILIGIIDVLPNYTQHPAYTWTQAAFLDITTILYQATIGPICFVIFAEIGSTRLRSQTVALTTSTGSIAQIIITIITPYMLNASAWNWRGKAGFFWGGISLIATVWCYFRLPETKGRTYDELDIMFENRVPVREFKTYKIEEIEPQLAAQQV